SSKIKTVLLDDKKYKITSPMSKTIIFFIVLTPYRLIYGFYIQVIIILLCISDYHCCFVY
ncbi:hypothetical protein N3930_21490, partial [Bacillus thuringiensis]|nr:hypothetical protein [Bacillus thuringiensis]